MIVQTASEGEPHFVSTMVEHMEFCGQIGRAFGNDSFEPVSDPEALYAIDNHDRGWDGYDLRPGLDPNTGLPYLMAHTPVDDALKTNRGSPEHNEQHSAYSGLLSSMHTWGLYNKRYGFSRFTIPNRKTVSVPISPENKAKVESMLEGEVRRQERLRTVLQASETTRRGDKQILQNYKHLQFCDTLALYFHLRHAADRGDETYIHVPMSREADASIVLKKIDDETYSLDPFPFGNDSDAVLVCRGRYMQPIATGQAPEDLGAVLRQLPADSQTFRLVPA